MIFSNTIETIVQYVAEGFLEIFSPHEDRYPAIGVQPYSGTISHHSHFDW